MNDKQPSPAAYSYWVIALISCLMLMWEVLLTRICALRLFFHFSFVVISNCLFGIAASGTMIFVLRDIFRRRVRFFVWLFSLFYLVALALTYLFLLSYEIEGEVRLVGLADIFRFSLFNLVAAAPFFFAGTVVGLILTFNAERVNTIYGSDLFGAAVGCLLTPLLLWKFGAGGAVIGLGLLGLAAFGVAAPARLRRGSAVAIALIAL